MKIQIGTITLKKQYEFTEYTECASWTRYVTCEPQTAPLYYDGSYWVFGSFNGILTSSTLGKQYQYEVGTPWKAGAQTQAFGGIGNWIDNDLFSINIQAPWELYQASEYSDGKPMFALRRTPNQDEAYDRLGTNDRTPYVL